MIQETIAEIEARIKKAGSLSDEKQRELLNLLSTLKAEVSEFSKVDIEHAQSITGFTEVSVHEAMRKKEEAPASQAVFGGAFRFCGGV